MGKETVNLRVYDIRDKLFMELYGNLPLFDSMVMSISETMSFSFSSSNRIVRGLVHGCIRCLLFIYLFTISLTKTYEVCDLM